MRSTLALRAALLAALAAGTAASPADAQRSTTRGFTAGAHIQGGSLEVENDDPSGGGGLGLRAGYGFNRNFTGYIEADGITFDVDNPDFGGEWSMAHVDLGVRYNFANSLRRWVPFLEAAIGARAVKLDNATVDGDSVGELKFSGGALSGGGGVAFFVHEKLAIETLLKFTGGTFEKVDVGNVSVNDLDIEASSFRFKLGVAWWP
ncbi:MAG TPA: outer membrane beta-barrel protein [Longimicrobiales bacterium]